MANRGLKKEHIYGLSRQKSRMYASVPCVEEVRINPDLKVAGLENMKNWLRDKKKIFFHGRETAQKPVHVGAERNPFVRNSGCGKSFSAKMIAQEWELPLFRFDIGSVYDKWVGESERKMREALSFIDNVAPCIVWIDEIEKALAVSDSEMIRGKGCSDIFCSGCRNHPTGYFLWLRQMIFWHCRRNCSAKEDFQRYSLLIFQ